MKVLDSGLALLAKPRIIHAIPGRMRLHFPIMKKFGKRYGNWALMICELISEPDGIEEVSPSLITGTVLLFYDHHKLTEQEILTFITSLGKIFISHRDELSPVAEQKPELVLDRLKEWLRSALTQRLHLDSRQRITYDVFN